MITPNIIIFSIIAFFLTIIFSVIGLGGAIFWVPILYLFGFDIHKAIFIGLIINIISCGSSVTSYLHQKLLNIKIATPLVISAFFGSLAGSYIKIDTKPLLALLALIVALAGFVMFFFKAGVDIKQETKTHSRAALILFGFVTGLVPGLLGLGSGTFMLPMLIFVFGVMPKEAVPVTLAVTLTAALVGALTRVTRVAVDMRTLGLIGAAVFLGAQVGPRFVFKRASNDMIRRLFGAALLVIALRLGFDLFR